MRARFWVLAMLAILATSTAGVAEVIPEAVPDLPVAGAQAYRGNDLITTQAANVAPTPKVVDGSIEDWTGTPSRFGGTVVRSHGELIYQDYVMDDWGADDGIDADRTAVTDPLVELEPRAYRPEILQQAAGEQFGAPAPFGTPSSYGDAEIPAELRDHADIAEVRVAADDTHLYFLVRTTGMTDPDATLVSILLDTADGGSLPHPAGGTTSAEHEIRAVGSQGQLTSHGLVIGEPITVATNAGGFVNAIEISIARDPFPDSFSLGVGVGVSADGTFAFAPVAPAGAVSNLVNVAFRFDEPARVWMDRDQALALRAGDTDAFRTEVELAPLVAGVTETFQPRPGYFERVYFSDSPVNAETTSGSYHQGAFQHYGVYIPTSYRPGSPNPATWWTHYRGGHAHDAAAWVPGLIRQLGEQRGNIIISPGARGTSTWYVGRGHEDFLDVWDDSMSSFSIDPNRVYMSGYSMGGYASWLLPLLYPDRFAASFPTAGPPTQGLWDGIGLVTTGANDGRAAEQLTFDVIANAANLGYVIYHGSNDELVPVTGAIRMATEMRLRGYPHRLYIFPGAEHFTNAIYDEWTDAARYLDTFVRDPNPPRVVYAVKPSLELAVEEVSAGGATLSYAFDGAYWVDGLTTSDPSATDPANVGTIDLVSLGRGMVTHAGVPEAGTGGQIAPHVWTGLRQARTGYVEPANVLSGTLENIATADIDLARAGLATAEPMRLSLGTDGPATIRLEGSWNTLPAVIGADASLEGGALVLTLDGAGAHAIEITP